MATARPPTILALGGGGFSMEPANPLLDEYVLAAAGVDRPRILFLPTASGDALGYTEDFHVAFRRLGARTAHLWLPWDAAEGAPPEAGRPGGLSDAIEPTRLLREQDVVYVGGGNTLRMLTVWRAYGLVDVLHGLWRAGTVLAGLSAGSICWFDSGVTDSIPGRLTPMTALGFLPGSHCPHYDGEPGRRPAYRALVGSGHLEAGLAADDGCALHYVDRHLARVVTSRTRAAAWRVEAVDGGVREERLSGDFLGD